MGARSQECMLFQMETDFIKLPKKLICFNLFSYLRK